ncbi:Oidioi.mRNA.OKI2018_I69.chr1.g2468.t1.cds [Oikopleura dioica]|uniref:Oidioi.mRNA.OKI2018_I69.chr1.g2468.t1.cds n=1 Tax=Oikopleura dioica TaxID=34765 RepID=A0ABN7SR70_OIKDI|nr:Oidioi.mRNA.OKI2018_I69.chr1.g2468.t1.cds [Oikopleura dioica]
MKEFFSTKTLLSLVHEFSSDEPVVRISKFNPYFKVSDLKAGNIHRDINDGNIQFGTWYLLDEAFTLSLVLCDKANPSPNSSPEMISLIFFLNVNDNQLTNNRNIVSDNNTDRAIATTTTRKTISTTPTMPTTIQFSPKTQILVMGRILSASFSISLYGSTVKAATITAPSNNYLEDTPYALVKNELFIFGGRSDKQKPISRLK